MDSDADVITRLRQAVKIRGMASVTRFLLYDCMLTPRHAATMMLTPVIIALMATPLSAGVAGCERHATCARLRRDLAA